MNATMLILLRDTPLSSPAARMDTRRYIVLAVTLSLCAAAEHHGFGAERDGSTTTHRATVTHKPLGTGF